MEGIADNYVIEDSAQNIIKIVGVGGGGSNAVNHMYKKGISGVSFVVCNTDDQALRRSPVPTKIQLGREITLGLGAGGKPEVARRAAEETREDIERMLSGETKMVFITAGMGGGTGTGAAPIVAAIAKEMNILTVGIVTIPFSFEGKKKIYQALDGVINMSPNVDALLVINNDRLRTIYPDLDITNGFAIADDVLTNAAKGIADIITTDGYINVDFADVSSTLRNGGTAIMNSGIGEGEHRVEKAIDNALESPLLNNNDIHKSQRILLFFYCSEEKPIKLTEMNEINAFTDKMGDEIEVIWGVAYDNSLDDRVKVTLLATGPGLNIIPDELVRMREKKDVNAQKTVDFETKGSDQNGVSMPVNVKNDRIGSWAGKLYEDLNKNVSISLEMLDDDYEKFREMETQPAFLRNLSDLKRK